MKHDCITYDIDVTLLWWMGAVKTLTIISCNIKLCALTFSSNADLDGEWTISFLAKST